MNAIILRYIWAHITIQISMSELLEVEKKVIGAFTALVVKLSEASFRPIFLKVSLSFSCDRCVFTVTAASLCSC